VSPFGGFLAPAAFVGLLTLPVVVLLYFLKLKREEYVISSTLLWQRSFEEMRVNSPFQRLRRNLLLLLQLLILTAGVLALARPVMNLAASEGRRFILLIDSSASMKTEDADGSRLDAAKARALELARDLGRGEEMAVIAFDSSARVLAPLTDLEGELVQAIKSIRASDTTTDLAAAMRIADGLARSRGDASESEIVILSDGRFGSMKDFTRFSGGEVLRRAEANEALGEAKVRFISVGKQKSDNTALVALEARRELTGAEGIEVFCRVANFGEREVTGPLELRLEGKLLDAKELSLEPGGETSTVFESLSWEDGVLEVRYNVRDSLAVDNAARAVMTDLREARVLLVTDENFFLEKAVTSVGGIGLDKVSPKAFQSMETTEMEKLLGYDCIICDGISPQIMQEGSFLIFDAYPPLKGLGPTGKEIETPQVLDWDPAHPATRFTNFAPLVIQKAPEVKWPKRAVTIVDGSGGTPLIGAISEERMNAVIVAFDIYESNWPLRRSFPIFLANAVRWLASGSPRRARANLRTGEVITIYPTGEPGVMRITDPGGKTHKVTCEVDSASYFSRTQAVGVYRGELGEEEYVWTVSLFSMAESDNAAAKSFELGAEGEVQAGEVERNREVWRYLAILAFMIVCFEWWVYNRRMYF